MKRRWILLLAIAALVLIAIAGWFVYRTSIATQGNASRATGATPQQRVQTINGETVVRVSVKAQYASHIEAVPIAAATLKPQQTAYVTVLDLQPLFDLRSRLAAARTDRDSAQGQADAANAEYERSRILFADDRNISQKALQNARASMQTAQAKLRLAEASQQAQETTLRLQFGEPLAGAAAVSSSPLLSRLARGQSTLLRVTLPADGRISVPATVMIDISDGKTIPAQKLSASKQIDPETQGASYLYIADSFLPIGTHTIAHVPLGDKSHTGVLIPKNAIVWYGGQPWAYLRTSANRFTRRYVESATSNEQGFVVAGGFRAGDQVVIRGAQLLLSEELRPQGIATQCKDPPECDG